MERMDMHSRNEYLKVLREKYLQAKTRQEKSLILDEYCGNTGQARKYIIRKIQPGVNVEPKVRRSWKEDYHVRVRAPLADVWKIFEYPCGQRLKPILEVEVDRLRELGELEVSDEVMLKLKRMSSATIDRKLKPQREVVHLLRSKGGPKTGSLLQQKIPIRLTEWDTSVVGYVEADMVVHCGASTLGEYVNTLSATRTSFSRCVVSKERVGGRLKRKYGVPKTPYQNLMASNQVSEEVKEELKDVYLGLNLS